MRRSFRQTIAALFTGGLLFAAAIVRAHQPGLSTLDVNLSTNHLNVRMIFAWQEIDTIIPLDGNQDRALSEAELGAAKVKLTRLAEGALDMVSDGRMLALKKPPEIVRDDEDNRGVRFHLQYEFPPTRVLTITSEILSELQRGHSQVARIFNSNRVELGSALLDIDKPSVDVPLFAIKEKPVASKTSTARHFLIMGVEHLVMGWDHLAFLFGLLVVGGKLRDAVKIITSFTVAHSISLALATFNLIQIPSSIVEPLIAASVIYVGFENIVRQNFSKRWILTFAFGLIHGCGFATVLRDLGVGEDGSSVVTPLIFFNLGVELGQLAIAAVMLPLIWKLKPTFPRRWVPATSAVVIALGGYFLVDRLWM
jgi:hydrogenase/urease accessory protein HupE